jgi:lysophospholipase L1-like esterase
MYKNLKTLFLMLLVPMTIVAQNKPFSDELRQFHEKESISMPPSNGIVFVGSSSLRMWTDLEETFKSYHAINRGFGGSELIHANDYIKELVLIHKPRQVVIYSGENDVASGASVDVTYERFLTLFTNLRKNLPKATITYISMKLSPSRSQFSKIILEANEKIKTYISKQKNASYVDIASKMLDSKGGYRPELFQADMLHMKPAGYQIWTREITPYLTKK